MRARWAAPLIVAALLVASCGGDDSESLSPPEVNAADFAFEKSEITVDAGTTVTWTNTGKTTHTIKGDGFFSKAVDPGETYEFEFSEPGSYDYLCTLHPDDMKGTIQVREL